MANEDLEDANRLTTVAFVEKDPFCYHLKTTYNELDELLRRFAKRSIQEGLGMIIKDEQDKIVSALAIYDQYNYDQNPVECPETVYSLSQLLNFLDTLTLEGYKARQPNDMFFLYTIAVDAEYGGQKIATEAVRWMTEEHPVVSKARVVWTQATSPVSTAVFRNLGWKSVYMKDPRLYTNSRGERPFEGLNETIKELNLKEFDGPHVLIKESISKE